MGCQTSAPVDVSAVQKEEKLSSSQILAKEDDVASSYVVKLLADNADFEALSVAEGKGIQQRDEEDGTKLSVGVNYSIEKGVISKDSGAKPPIQINVVGMTADEVADEIIGRLPPSSAANGQQEGNVIVLTGLSGTGKGTTVAKLQKKLPRVITWSNGNAFRALTHLIVAAVGRDKAVLTAEDITPERVRDAVSKLSFEKFTKDGEPSFDVVIGGSTRVSEIQNTVLKAPVISSNVPSVAEQTQGEVILFARNAVKTLQENGFNVILEGRSQTLDYIPTELRFELVMSEVKLLGQRRAAQRVMAHAVSEIKKASGGNFPQVSDAEVESYVKASAKALCV